MTENFMCVSIPKELSQSETVDGLNCSQHALAYNFGTKIFKNKNGIVEHVDYYSTDNELIKQIYYDGFSISAIKYYRDGILYEEEHYFDCKIVSKGSFDKSSNTTSGIAFQYNRQNKITEIKKSFSGNIYSIEYGYDKLERVNSRKLYINNKNILEQYYNFDILDRVVEYRDNNQQINVLKIGEKQELLAYTILDKKGNLFLITNNFESKKYKNTEITLNGQKIIKVSSSYTDNVMLKRPYTTENDLDLVITSVCKSKPILTRQTNLNNMSQNLISGNIDKKIVPISMRKRLLYNQVVNM